MSQGQLPSVPYVNTGTQASPVLTPVGTMNDGTYQRLAVQALVTGNISAVDYQSSPAIANKYMTKLANGTATSLLVNGSTTNQTFKVSANASGGKLITVSTLRFVMTGQAIYFNGTYFGSGNTLTNGCVLTITSNSTAYAVTTFKINEDFLVLSGPDCQPSTTGSWDYMVADIALNQPLVAGSTDNISLVIKDNLANAGLGYFQAEAYGVLT